MKRIYLLLAALLAVTTLSAQNPTTYFMTGTPLRGAWNPAFTPDRGYINIPVVGGIQIGTEGNLALDKIFYPTSDGSLTTLFSGSIPAATVLEDLDEMNRLGVAMNINLIGFGAYTKKRGHFWAFDLNLRSNTDTNFPYELFDFMKNGTSANIADLGLENEEYLEAGFSYTFPLLKNRMQLGIRAKFLVGLARASVNFSQFDAHLGADSWSAHAVGALEMSGMMPATKQLEDGRVVYDMEEIANDFTCPAGYGFGFDVGTSVTLFKHLTLSASINDLGMLFWSESASSKGVVDREILFTGVETDEDGKAIQPEFDLDELEFDVQPVERLNKGLRASFNLGAEYNFLDSRIGVGAFYHAKLWEYKTRHNLTLSANFRPLKWLHFSGSYSFVDNRAHAVGLALNLCPSFINFFVGTDILLSKKTPQWVPISQSNMNLTFGLAVPLGKRPAAKVSAKKSAMATELPAGKE